MTTSTHLPDVEVFVMTPSEWREAAERGLATVGLTWDELAEQARTGDYSSLEARKLWVIIGGSRP